MVVGSLEILFHLLFLFCTLNSDVSLELPPRYPCHNIKPPYIPKPINKTCPSDFSYGDGPTGPDNWPAMFGSCDGDKQSPINIDMSDLRRLKAAGLDWSPAYFNTPKSMTLTNIGHKLVLRATFPHDCQPRLSSGPLRNVYTFKNIEFHWGSVNSKGSEHTIDEYSYPMEMHVVHAGGLLSKPQTVIVAYFFQIGRKQNGCLDNLLDVFTKAVKYKNREIELKRPFSLSNLLYAFSAEYITYDGSLTTPPCTEGVRWLVYPYPLEISMRQLEKFRTVCKYSRDLANNYRPIQPLNNRNIYFVS